MKVCRGCGEAKPRTDFYRHRRMADGRLNYCRLCVSVRVRRHRQESEATRIYDRQRTKTPARRAHIASNALAWRQRNPDGYRAHIILNNAVRDGQVVKPGRCSACGDVAARLHGHHEDYSRPLDVEWLCPRCHASHLRKIA